MTFDRATVQSVGNLPVSLTETFSSDDFALITGTCLPEAAFLLDVENCRVLAANLRFLELLGIDAEAQGRCPIPWDQVLHPEDAGGFKLGWDAVIESGESRLETRLRRHDSTTVDVSLYLQSFRWKRRNYFVGFVCDPAAPADGSPDLKRLAEEQKERAFIAIRASLRMYQFNQKIRRMPLLTKKILDAEKEEDLFAEAANVLTSEEGLDYQDATFLLQEGEVLKVVLSTSEPAGSTYPIAGDNRFATFLRGGLRAHGSHGPGILVPLQSRGKLIGIFEVISHPKEKVFFDESSMLSEWQEDVLLDIGGIIAVVMDNLRLNREVKRQSILDPLTQVYNRHYFIGRLRAEAERARRYGRPASVIFVDVDHFKEINDACGHFQGDQVLRELSRVFVESLREVDVVCRFGGDEFVILLPETDLEMACKTATKLLQGVERTKFRNIGAGTEDFRVTISVGVSTLRTGQSEEDLLQMADAALYKAKTAGRNRYAVFSG